MRVAVALDRLEDLIGQVNQLPPDDAAEFFQRRSPLDLLADHEAGDIGQREALTAEVQLFARTVWALTKDELTRRGLGCGD